MTIVGYDLLDHRGRHVATHARRIDAHGRKVAVWWERDGRPGLDGLRTADLPLYGSELARSWSRDLPVIVTEGEPAAQALIDAGWQAAGTVTGAAGCPSTDSLAILNGYPVILWSDADGAGCEHMGRVETTLRGIASSVRWLTWPDAPDGGDAADAIREGAAIGELVDAAGPMPRRHAPPAIRTRPRRTAARPTDSPIARFKAVWTVSAVLAARWGVVEAAPGKCVRCPAHEDRSPSLSIARDDQRVWCWSPGCVLANGGRGRDSWDLERLAGGAA